MDSQRSVRKSSQPTIRYRSVRSQQGIRRSSRRSSGPQGPSNQITALIQQHPGFCIVTAWLTFLVLAGLAGMSLVRLKPQPQPEPVQTELTNPAPGVMPDRPTSSEGESFSQYRTFLLVILGCSTGCLLASRWYGTRQQQSKRSSAAAQVTGATETFDYLPPGRSSATPDRPPQRSNSRSKSESTAVTPVVLPADQDHPLDWDEPSLADSLDLRQRRPLSYWLER
jgi:hypothetical protein